MHGNRTRFRAAALIALGALIAMAVVELVASRQVAVPRPEDTRFQLISSEPIAGADGRSHVPGWSVLVFRDRKTDRCFVAFKRDESIDVQPGAPCTP